MTVRVLPAIAAVGLLLASQPARADTGVAVTNSGGTFGVRTMSWRDIPFRTIVRQQYDYSCGSAALATLLRYHYGRDVGEAQIFRAMYDKGDQAKIRKVGFSLLDMKRYLDSQGLAGDGYKLTIQELTAARRPSIAVIKIGPYRHFVVIKGVMSGRILVGDPALGLKIYTFAEFTKIWDGVVFAIHDRPADHAVFNQEAEWRPWTSSPINPAMSDDSLSRLTWAMPSVYQVAPVLQSMAVVPLPGSP